MLYLPRDPALSTVFSIQHEYMVFNWFIVLGVGWHGLIISSCVCLDLLLNRARNLSPKDSGF